MKIIVLHGENVPESYDRLQKFIQSAKDRAWEITSTSDTSSSLAEIISSESLFSKDRLVIVEDIKLLTKKTIDWMKKNTNSIQVTMIIYSKTIISKTFIKSLPKVDKVEEFTLPKHIWTLLDSLYPGNSKNILILLHKLGAKEPLEFVFSLIAKTLRDIYWVKKDSKGLPYPSWRITKLQRQSQRYDETQLKSLISDLADIDIKVKTSQAELLSELDFLIATKLQ
jgi:DNA polymerase III delta subunit